MKFWGIALACVAFAGMAQAQTGAPGTQTGAPGTQTGASGTAKAGAAPVLGQGTGPDWWMVRRTKLPIVQMSTRSNRTLVGSILKTVDVNGTLPEGRFAIIEVATEDDGDQPGEAYLSAAELDGLLRCFELVAKEMETPAPTPVTLLWHATEAGLEAGAAATGSAGWQPYIRFKNGPTFQFKPREVQGIVALLTRTKAALEAN